MERYEIFLIAISTPKDSRPCYRHHLGVTSKQADGERAGQMATLAQLPQGEVVTKAQTHRLGSLNSKKKKGDLRWKLPPDSKENSKSIQENMTERKRSLVSKFNH